MKQFLIVLASLLFATVAVAENPRSDVGMTHNDQVIYVLQNLDYLPAKEDMNEVVAQSLCNYVSVIDGGCIWPPFPGYPWPWPWPGQPTGPWLMTGIDFHAEVSELGLSVDLEHYVHESVNLAEQGLPLADFDVALTALEEEAASVLSADDLWTFYGHTSVARQSSILWTSQAEGGLGGVHYLNPATGVDTQEAAARINWWKVAIRDAIGYLQGGPWGAVGASLVSVLQQL